MTNFATSPASSPRSFAPSGSFASSGTPAPAPRGAGSAAEPLPTRITRYRLTPEQVPVDFFADPDGHWDFASLVEMAGFNPEHPGASVGALTAPFDGYPEGSAVITEVGVECYYVALAELPKTLFKEATSNRHTLSGATSVRKPHRAA